MENKKIFLSGGAGFISSHILDKLLDDNKVIVYDNFHRNALKFNKFAVNHKNIEIIEGDILDYEKLNSALKGVDYIVHSVAIAGIYSVVEDTLHTFRVNLFGTQNILKAAKENKVKKLIDISTSEVYGSLAYKIKESDPTAQGPVGEDRWVYAISKLAAEHLSFAFTKDDSFSIFTVRPFNIYGPRQVGEGAIQRFINQSISNEKLTLYNDGTQIRAWCYVTDFVDAIVKMLELDDNKTYKEVFNIGNPQGTITNLKLAKMIIRLTESKSKIKFKPHPGPEVDLRIPSIKKAKDVLNFEPKISLEPGLTKSIEWYRNHSLD